ncbi:hypothetical protein N1F78_00205 [Seonamhaeicola sp. MEBiC1930]|uniref:hypothetical protein n=1 Tax=Seonamhaeicola sp. MEBiC01930 TaxID=2976768 RepID=UPI003255CB58
MNPIKLPLLIFTLLSFYFVDAQKIFQDFDHFDRNWSFGLGINTVDDSGRRFDPFNKNKNLAHRIPIMVSAEYHQNQQFSYFGVISINQWAEGELIDGSRVSNSTPTFFGVDLGVKYSFRKLLNIKIFDPYIAQGFGYSTIGRFTNNFGTEINPDGRLTANTTLGVYFWLSKYWGINLNGTAKISLTNDTNLSQFGLGIVYLTK